MYKGSSINDEKNYLNVNLAITVIDALTDITENIFKQNFLSEAGVLQCKNTVPYGWGAVTNEVILRDQWIQHATLAGTSKGILSEGTKFLLGFLAFFISRPVFTHYCFMSWPFGPSFEYPDLVQYTTDCMLDSYTLWVCIN